MCPHQLISSAGLVDFLELSPELSATLVFLILLRAEMMNKGGQESFGKYIFERRRYVANVVRVDKHWKWCILHICSSHMGNKAWAKWLRVIWTKHEQVIVCDLKSLPMWTSRLLLSVFIQMYVFSTTLESTGSRVPPPYHSVFRVS